MPKPVGGVRALIDAIMTYLAGDNGKESVLRTLRRAGAHIQLTLVEARSVMALNFGIELLDLARKAVPAVTG